MTESRVRIEMPTADLEDLQKFLATHEPPEVRIVPIHDTTAEGVRQEPVTITLVAIAGTVAGVKALARVVKTWLEQKGNTERAALAQAQAGMKLTLEREGRQTVVTLEELVNQGD